MTIMSLDLLRQLEAALRYAAMNSPTIPQAEHFGSLRAQVQDAIVEEEREVLYEMLSALRSSTTFDDARAAVRDYAFQMGLSDTERAAWLKDESLSKEGS